MSVVYDLDKVGELFFLKKTVGTPYMNSVTVQKFAILNMNNVGTFIVVCEIYCI